MTSDGAARRTTVVVAAAVVEREGHFLMTRRLEGTHLAGCWEFPGGKRHDGETLEQCLIREIREELACEAVVERLLVSTSHDYAERSVSLHFFACALRGEPHPQDGQEMRWVSRQGLRELELPDADQVLVDLLTAQDSTRPTEGA